MDPIINLSVEEVKLHLTTHKIIQSTAQFYKLQTDNITKGFQTYGPIGFTIKQNIINQWRKQFMNNDTNIHEIETPTIMYKDILVNSGHATKFTDFIIVTDSSETFRADHLVHDHCTKNNISLDIPIDSMSSEQLLDLVKFHNMVKDAHLAKITTKNLMFELKDFWLRPELAQGIFCEYKNFYDDIGCLPFGLSQVGKSYRNEISPHSFVRLREFTQAEIEWFFDPLDQTHPLFFEIKDLVLPFYSQKSQTTDKEITYYKIEDALVLGLLANEIMGYFLGKIYLFAKSLGFTDENIRFRQHLPEEMAHYAVQCWDLEIKLSNGGWLECVGCAYRGDYDLKVHNIKNQHFIQKYTKKEKKISLVFTSDTEKKLIELYGDSDLVKKIKIDFYQNYAKNNYEELPEYVTYLNIPTNFFSIQEKIVTIDSTVLPHVIEPSIGIDRIIYALANNLLKKRVSDENRIVFLLPISIVPYDIAIFSLSNKPELNEFIKKLKFLESDYKIYYDFSSVAIGKKYVRCDSIGVPFAITIDFTSLIDDTVTLRFIKDGSQKRFNIKDISIVYFQHSLLK